MKPFGSQLPAVGLYHAPHLVPLEGPKKITLGYVYII
jgi:hypothetical protein